MTTMPPNYAIIDIETTGTSYKTGKITEIAIIIHNGTQIIDEFTSLVNPEQKIPYQITQLTGINDRMVRDAPKFCEIARKIIEITQDCVFVAHNASFDYNFIRQEFKYLFYEYDREKLCTVKLSRKLIPGRRSYSLGNLCGELKIENPHRHRAYGDARATTSLLELLLTIDPDPMGLSLNGLNSSLQPEYLKALPEQPGVYYLLDENQNIIYVGKSKNIKSRVLAHLTNCATKRALEMKNKVKSVDYELTGNELIALLFESHEINHHKPMFNRAQRRSMYNFGLFNFMDEKGYLRLKIDALSEKDTTIPLITFTSQMAAKSFLFTLAEENRLCQKLCGLYESANSCFQYKIKECYGACVGEESPEDYNIRVQEIIDRYVYKNQSFMIIDHGKTDEENSVVWVENGKYRGFGFASKQVDGYDTLSYLRDCVKPYHENKYVHSIIRSYLENNPQAKVITC